VSAATWELYVERPRVMRRAPHSFTRKILHWMACTRCGLILLKNEASRRAAKKVCAWEEDQG
jgi:hypothetical protein